MKFAVNWFHNVNLALYSNRIMSDRCLVHGCSNRSDMNVGISAHFSPPIKSERDTWLRFLYTHRANLNPSGKNFDLENLMCICLKPKILPKGYPFKTEKL